MTNSGRATRAPAAQSVSHAHVRLDEVDRVRLDDAGYWRPIRRTLALTAIGANAYTADHPGDALIEPHDERSPGAGGHEELYVVLSGAATFIVAGETVDAPTGTLVRVDVGVQRSAIADEANTTVLVVGGWPDAAMPPSPFEYWYAAQPAYQGGQYERAVAIASEGLVHYPEHGALNYQLACYLALSGNRSAAAERLRIAFAADARTRTWARDDRDLDGVPRHDDSG